MKRLRVWLAEWLAPEGYLVMPAEVFETLLDINMAYANERLKQALQLVPQLFDMQGQKETRH